jgi:pimeloyl-ACP methyl ester carboxylesterase
MECLYNPLQMKPHLLLLHGALGSAATLQPLAQLLAGDFSVHSLNFPGHGGTALPQAFSIPSFAHYVQQYCSTQALGRVSIFGYSMGGYVGMYLAKHEPELVSGLATLATKFYWDEAVAAKEVKMLQPPVMEQKMPQLAVQLRQRHAPNDWKEVVQKTAELLTGLGENNVLRTGDYPAINTPSLIMLGDRDKMVSMEETVAAQRLLPQAQLAILPGTPHPLEQTDVTLLSFLLKRFFMAID